jgi:hypothetical protein
VVIVRAGASKAEAGAPDRANAEKASAKPKHADVIVFIKNLSFFRKTFP